MQPCELRQSNDVLSNELLDAQGKRLCSIFSVNCRPGGRDGMPPRTDALDPIDNTPLDRSFQNNSLSTIHLGLVVQAIDEWTRDDAVW
jgi:hypothetical protein